ncbi:LuxR C-terminal-related transcriptional regulator [Bacillus sp. T33-2]|uniref:LuxR C-terminal-related transcriptional regulator n=1 Tax=Bacillus sp. T33-2 TaxID=2054168 RepID=UPI000C779ED1|nr:LuxR C-terminal-related transcriptional regulator [Bacillus sp. T33-2]PLR96366.1 hypothetical protein CVD19_11835 [Bacillus sp. T33-2]
MLIVSMKNQMNELVRKSASIISDYQTEIQEEWDQIFHRLKQNQTLIDFGADAPEQLKQISVLFWNHLSGFYSNNIDETFKTLQSVWAQKLNVPFNSHKLILLFTMLENAIHKVVEKNDIHDFHIHQSIQHFFSLIVQRLFTNTHFEVLNVDFYISELFRKKENPFLWAAKVQFQDDAGFKILAFTSHDGLLIDEVWKKMILNLHGPSLNILSDAILRLLVQTSPADDLEVFPLTMGSDTYLFCINKRDAGQLKPFFTLSLELLQQSQHLHENMQIKNDWKDALILFDEWIMLARNFDEAVEKVVSGFVNYLPFQRAALFYYSETENGEQIGLGVIGHKIDTKDIRNIRENLNNLPQIKKTMTRIQPMYVPSANSILPERFIQQFELKSLVIAPIYSTSNNQVWGGVFLDQGEGKAFEVSQTILSVLTKFGQHAGEILSKYSSGMGSAWSSSPKTMLTNREIDILRLMAEGKTIDEAADLLYLSKYTVRDYISFIIKKLGAQNRTQAIAKAIREGLI